MFATVVVVMFASPKSHVREVIVSKYFDWSMKVTVRGSVPLVTSAVNYMNTPGIIRDK